MSRSLRIETKSNWYYVRNFGRKGAVVFKGEPDFSRFCALLAEACLQHDIECHSYTLLATEFHLLLYINRVNLSRFMRQLSGVYTQQYNRKYQLNGALFKGRYQSSLLDPISYPLQLSLYIHQLFLVNAKSPLGNKSSYACYAQTGISPEPVEQSNAELNSAELNNAEFKKIKEIKANVSCLLPDTNEFIHTNKLIEQWQQYLLQHSQEYSPHHSPKNSRKYRYQQVVRQPLVASINEPLAHSYLPAIIGSTSFKDRYQSLIEHSSPECSALTQMKGIQDQQAIIALTARNFDISESGILQSQYGVNKSSDARNMAMYLCQQHTNMTLIDIAALFGISHYASVSNRISYFKNRLQHTPLLQQYLHAVNQQLHQHRHDNTILE